jgi:PAS domain S-box-containing protein
MWSPIAFFPARQRKCWRFFVLAIVVLAVIITDVQAEKAVILRIGDNLPPYEFIDSNGNPDGFTCDVMQAISKETGMTYSVVAGDQGYGNTTGDEGTVRPVFVTGPSRDPTIRYIPLTRVEYWFFTLPETEKKIGNIRQENRVILSRKGAMREVEPIVAGDGSRVLWTETPEDALMRLKLGSGDIAVVERAQGEFIIDRSGLSGINVLDGYAAAGDYSLEIANAEPELIAMLDQGLQEVRDSGEMDRISGKWLSSQEMVAGNSSLYLYLFTPFALIMLTAFSWSWALRYQVAKKAADLEKELKVRRQAESDLIKARNHLNNVIDTIADPVFVKDRDHRYVILNDACCRIMGHSREELIGKKDGEIFAEDEARLFHERDEQVFSTGQEAINEEHLTTGGGTATIILTKKSLYTDIAGEQYIVGVISDITEQKNLEESLKRFNEQLEDRVRERTNALENANRELESFTYTVSHDLRAPLRAIDGYSTLLLTESIPRITEPDARLLIQIRKNSRHMAQLIDDLLNFSHIGRKELNKIDIDLTPLIQAVLDDLKDERKGRDVRITLGPLPYCHADPLLLPQVYFNILSNALKFTRSKDPVLIDIGAFEQEGKTVYYVRDNGIGFDMKYKEKIFSPFQRLHSIGEFEGTGVGLAIVHRIITRHGGSVWAESEERKGTTFYFTLG